MAHRMLFNDDWRFSKAPLGSCFDDIQNWENVEVPHDWLIYDANNLYETGEGWYTKDFLLDGLTIGQEKIFIRFEGVYMDSSLFVNGRHVDDWKYGYSTFEMDITDYAVSGHNNITVKVVYQSPNSRWYSGAGLYRNVWLIRKQNTYIPSDSIYISPRQLNGGAWEVFVDTKIKHAAEHDKGLTLGLRLYDPQGQQVFRQDYPADQADHSVSFTVDAPMQWDLQTPQNIYTLTVSLYADGDLTDESTQTFGFRSITFDTDKGFFLNGRHVNLNGVCQHHDLGALGAAMNKSALRRQLSLLKEMGANAIRTSHNMPAVELMELADEIGFLICSEALDMWERSKTPYDYGRFFPDWVEKDFESWICRDRNHPSLIMWSIGNEIYDTHADERGLEITHELLALVKRFDYRGNAPATIGSNYMPWENAQKCADVVKLAGYNYAERLYDTHHQKYRDWIIYGSETSSVVQSRGIYHFPLGQSVLSDDDEQCSSLGNSSTSWGAKSMEHCIIDHRDAPFALGQFIWTGTDYIGEPTPYDTKNSYFGQIDTAGFPKDAFYFYQSQWTDYETNPMIHLFPYWDFSEGQMIDVRVCSNAPEIELFLNDESLGRVKLDRLHGQKLLGDWQIKYQKGTLRAVAYSENGDIIAQDSQTSFGDAREIVISPEQEQIKADGADLAFLEINMQDADGHTVENANNRVFVHVSGPGRLVGLDNGDSTNYDQYKGNSMRLFSGKLLAIIAPTFEPGHITVTVESQGMEPKSVVIHSVGADIPQGVSTYLPHNRIAPPNPELPVRKIELVLDRHQLDQNHQTATVRAALYPQNASYQDIEWRVTNAAGISSNRAELEVTGPYEARIKALGDGLVYIRCATKNGSDKIKLISQIELTIDGMGQTLFDPYDFIAGGFYIRSNVELTNGNERGVATLRDGESHVGFSGIDFGDYGSDEITIPIFGMDNSPFTFDIWEGMPGDPDSDKLCTVPYEKGSEWNVYREETYKLPRRLKGVTTICFVFNRKVHIKGFSFKKLEKAYQQLYVASEKSSLYGDSFLIQPDSIEQIGNNVTIVFDDMDFCRGPVNTITICGRTALDTNTIQVRLAGEDTDRVEVLAFKHSADYMEQTFAIGQIEGRYTVNFVFLPGSQFDFKWFRFS